MLEVITGYGNCLKYKDRIIQKFKKKSLNWEYYRITSKEQNDKSQIIAQVYFNPSKRNVSNLKNCILWYEKRLSEGRYEYSFGLNSENNLKIPSKYDITFKENFSLKINYNAINESQLVFAKDPDTFKTYLMIKLDVCNLSETELNHFINKHDLFLSNEDIENCYFLNLGDVRKENTIYNFFSFISEVRAVDNSTPYLKIVPIKTPIYESVEIEKGFNRKLDEIFDENLFSEDILFEESIKNLNDKLSQSLKSNKDLETRLNNLSNENKTLKNTNKDLELKLDKLSDENSSLKKSYEKIENKDLIKEKETLANTNKDLETKLKQSSEENESLIKSRQDLAEKLANRKLSLIKANNELEKNLEELKKVKETLTKEQQYSEKKLNELNEENKAISKDYKKLETKSNKLIKEKETLKQAQQNLKTRLDELTKENKTLKKTNKDLEIELSKSSREKESLNKNNKDLEIQLEKLSDESKTLKKFNNDLEIKLKDSEKLFNDKIKEFEELSNKNNNLEKELETISSKNKKLENTKKKDSTEKRKLKKSLKELNSEIEKNNEKINKFDDLYYKLKASYDNKINALEKENSDLKLKLGHENSDLGPNDSNNSKSDHCKVCGKKFKKTDNFCTECGAKRIR